MCQNICYSVRPLQLLLKFAGFGLFTLDRRTFKSTITACDAILILTNIGIALMLNHIYWMGSFVISIHSSEIVKIFYPTVFYLNCCILNGTKIWHFYHRHKLAELLKLIDEIDNDLRKIGNKFDYNRQRIFVIKMIIVINVFQSIVSLSMFCFQYFYKLNIRWNVFAFVAWSFFTNFVLVGQFIITICGFRQRYKAMNELISLHQDYKTVKASSRIHLKLLNASSLINKTLSPLMMFSFGTAFCMFCIFTYSVFIMGVRVYRTSLFFGISGSIFNVHVYMVTLGALWICDATVKEQRKTSKILYRILLETPDRDKKYDKVCFFIQQLATNKLKFSCGFFDFNWKLCFQMISAATMYFVILFQFDDAIPKRFEVNKFSNITTH